jgi:hypothetical protein
LFFKYLIKVRRVDSWNRAFSTELHAFSRLGHIAASDVDVEIAFVELCALSVEDNSDQGNAAWCDASDSWADRVLADLQDSAIWNHLNGLATLRRRFLGLWCLLRTTLSLWIFLDFLLFTCKSCFHLLLPFFTNLLLLFLVIKVADVVLEVK